MNLDSHWDLGWIQMRKAGANPLGSRHHTAHTGGNVVCALVAMHLKRHSRHGVALEAGILGVLIPGVCERGQKSAHCRAEPGARDVDLHRRPLHIETGLFLRFRTYAILDHVFCDHAG